MGIVVGVTILIAILVIAATYQFFIIPSELKSHQNQQYEYLYNCSGVSYFQSQTTFLSPSFMVNDSLAGPGYFSLQLNVATDNQTFIQAVALIQMTAGVVYTQLDVETWIAANQQPTLYEHSRASIPFSILMDVRFALDIVRNNTQQYTAMLRVIEANSSSPVVYLPLQFQLAAGPKMVEAQAGVYGLGNSSKATFGPAASTLFAVALSTNSSVRTSSLGDNCGEGQWGTAETSNLTAYNVTASAHSVTYSLKSD